MSALTRYLSREFLPVFIFANVLVLFVLTMFQMAKLAEVIFSKGGSVGEGLTIVGAMFVSFLPASIPISCLAASNMVIGRMSQDSEIIALVTSGIPIRKVLNRLFALGVMVAILMLGLSLYGVPRANFLFNDLMQKIAAKSASVAIRPGVFIEDFHGLLVFVEEYNSARNQYEKVFVYDQRDETMPMVILGKTAELSKSEDSNIKFVFHDGEIHVNRKNDTYQKIVYTDYQMNIPVSFSFGNLSEMPIGMTYPELNKEMTRAASGTSKWDLPTLQLEHYRRLLLPVACLLFLVLGTLFGLGHYRNLRGRPVVTSLGFTAIYWTMFLVTDQLARNGKLAVLPASLIPNAVMLFLIIIVWRNKRTYI